jgi:putative hydrolase of the HAD superfamily
LRATLDLVTGAGALLLDALGTLVSLAPPAPPLARELARRFAIEVSVGEAQRALTAEIAYYREHFDQGRDRESVAALRIGCARALRAALPASDRLAQVPDEALAAALLASLGFTAFADARPAIVAARARGQRVVVVSNWDVSLGDVLARVGLMSLLHGVVTSAGAGARKPSEAIFARALEIAGVAPDRAVHVGDTPAEDVAGARAAGIAPILIRRDGSPGPAGVPTIASLLELVR